MNRNTISIFLLTLLVSCGSYNSKTYDPPEIYQAIDKVYETVLRHEFKEVGSKVVIVDRSMGTTSIDVEGYDFVENDSIEYYRWNKNLIYAKFLDQRLIAEYKLNQRAKYFELINKFTYHGDRAWFELWIPKFTADRRTAIIELFLNKGKFQGRNFWVHCAWLVKWDKKAYRIAKYYSIDRSHN